MRKTLNFHYVELRGKYLSETVDEKGCPVLSWKSDHRAATGYYSKRLANQALKVVRHLMRGPIEEARVVRLGRA
jgi:hypothetical protein